MSSIVVSTGIIKLNVSTDDWEIKTPCMVNGEFIFSLPDQYVGKVKERQWVQVIGAYDTYSDYNHHESLIKPVYHFEIIKDTP